MADERNKAIARRLFQEILDERKLGAIPNIVAKNYALHNLPPGLPKGIEGFRDLIRMYHAGFPDFFIKIEELPGESDRVGVRWIGQATHGGPSTGIHQTEKNTNNRNNPCPD
jgi:predicted ester cyclase